MIITRLVNTAAEAGGFCVFFFQVGHGCSSANNHPAPPPPCPIVSPEDGAGGVATYYSRCGMSITLAKNKDAETLDHDTPLPIRRCSDSGTRLHMY